MQIFEHQDHMRGRQDLRIGVLQVDTTTEKANPSMWPLLSSPFEHFLPLLSHILHIVLMNAY